MTACLWNPVLVSYTIYQFHASHFFILILPATLFSLKLLGMSQYVLRTLHTVWRDLKKLRNVLIIWLVSLLTQNKWLSYYEKKQIKRYLHFQSLSYTIREDKVYVNIFASYWIQLNGRSQSDEVQKSKFLSSFKKHIYHAQPLKDYPRKWPRPSVGQSTTNSQNMC